MAEDRRERQALLDQDSDEDDDFFLHGPKTHGIRQQIDEVTNIAKDNIIRIAERGERLDSLEERSARLQQRKSHDSAEWTASLGHDDALEPDGLEAALAVEEEGATVADAVPDGRAVDVAEGDGVSGDVASGGC